MGEMPVHLVGTVEDPQEGSGRWLWRLKNFLSGNFFGTQGKEKQRLIEVLRSENVSVVLCHFGQTALRLLPAAEAAGIPLVVHFHGLDISSSLGNRWYRWSLIRMIPRFAAIVCVGSEQRRRLIRLGAKEEKIHLIPCGVPTESFPMRSFMDRDTVRFICVSRLVPWKGVDYCIGAFARIADSLPGAELLVVGEGKDRAHLEVLSCRSGVSDRVRFKGAIPEHEVRAMLEESDVFLQHSLDHGSGWFEGFGVSVSEACAIGLPVVVSACGGLLDQVEDGVNGIVVPQRDEEAMAMAMMRLASDPGLRRSMGRAGRERMVSEFDTTLQVGKLEQVLLEASVAKP